MGRWTIQTYCSQRSSCMYKYIIIYNNVQCEVKIVSSKSGNITTTLNFCLEQRTGYAEVGCFKDANPRAFSGDVVKFFPSGVVLEKCYERAYANKHRYFGIQVSEECRSDDGDTYDKYGSTTGCVNGLGGAFKNTVYEVIGEYHITAVTTGV